MIRGINHIAINSGDIAQLAAFYNEVLGFGDATGEFSWRDAPELDAVMGVRGSIAKQRMLRAGNCYLELFEFEAPEARPGGANRACDRGFTHLALDVQDIDAEFERLKALGMHFLIDAPVQLGDLRVIYGQDPDGNLIELIEPSAEHPYSLTQLDAGEAGSLL